MYVSPKKPLVRNDQAAVREWIDARIASYQRQREDANRESRKFDAKIGDALINELLDFRNVCVGVPQGKPEVERQGAD